MSTSPLIGLVLMGGKSLRMGRDKAFLDYHGVPQYQYLFDLLSSLCDKSLLSCNAEQAKLVTDLPLIVDDKADLGPMGGVLSCFRRNPQCALLTVPCDLPRIDSQSIAQWIKSRNTSAIATTAWNNERQDIEPLLTIWEPAAFPILQFHSGQGRNSPYKILKQSAIEITTALDPAVLENVNTLEDYQKRLQTIL